MRTPRIGADRSVRLKPREKTGEFWDWDDKLTLEFSGERPCVCAVLVFPAPGVPTLYLAGDSTVCDQPYEPFASWGQMLPRFFGPNAAIANHAESGESLRSFVGEGRLAKLDTLMRPGDLLFIQFGHNDQKERGEGVGAFTTYKEDLERFVADARAHGADTRPRDARLPQDVRGRREDRKLPRGLSRGTRRRSRRNRHNLSRAGGQNTTYCSMRSRAMQRICSPP